MKILRENNRVRFIELDKPANRKTYVIEFRSNIDNELLGQIKWNVSSKSYCFKTTRPLSLTYETLEAITEIIAGLETERMLGIVL